MKQAGSRDLERGASVRKKRWEWSWDLRKRVRCWRKVGEVELLKGCLSVSSPYRSLLGYPLCRPLLEVMISSGSPFGTMPVSGTLSTLTKQSRANGIEWQSKPYQVVWLWEWLFFSGVPPGKLSVTEGASDVRQAHIHPRTSLPRHEDGRATDHVVGLQPKANTR